MQKWLTLALSCLLIPMARGSEEYTSSRSEVGKANDGIAPNRDEQDNTQNLTQVPIAELQQWGSRPIRCHFVVINDTHVGPGEMRGLDKAMLRLEGQKPNFIVFTGDLTFGQGESESTKRESFKSLVEAAKTAQCPFYLGMGNTDMIPGEDPVRAFRESTGTSPYYSFDNGGVHFVMLYTERQKPDRFGTIDAAQLEWLKGDLKAMKEGTPVVLFGHHALYPDENKWEQDNWGIDNSLQLLEVLQPYHLIATFSSHRHLNRMGLDSRGVLHVINGAMVNDHSDDIGPKKDGVGYRWVSLTDEQISTTWIQVGLSEIPKR